MGGKHKGNTMKINELGGYRGHTREIYGNTYLSAPQAGFSSFFLAVLASI